jgi:hypothetical protein
MHDDGKVKIGRLREPYNVKNGIAKIDEFEGRPYAWLDILQIAVYTILAVFKPFVPKRYRTGLEMALLYRTGTRKLFCSEAVAYVMLAAKPETRFKKALRFVMPIDIVFHKEIKWLK